jgi:Glycosyltransferases involved in cell wall biogenesis
MCAAVISIIVPVYKAEQYLHKCVDSILSQTFSDFELLLIDDGSPDNSGKICDDYEAKDSRIRVIHKENGGASSARNAGLEKAMGEWVCFVDSDDWIERNCLEVVHHYAVEDELDCIQFSYKRINKEGNVVLTEVGETPIMNLKDYIDAGVFCFRAGGTLLKMNVINSLNLRFIEGLRLAEDQLFMLTAMAHCKRMRRISDSFYCYFINENSVTENTHFNEVCDSIIAYNEFKYKDIFHRHIDSMILAQSFAALKLADCRILVLYGILKNIKIKTKTSELDGFNMKFLKLMWTNFLLPALFLLKLEFKIRRYFK